MTWCFITAYFCLKLTLSSTSFKRLMNNSFFCVTYYQQHSVTDCGVYPCSFGVAVQVLLILLFVGELCIILYSVAEKIPDIGLIVRIVVAAVYADIPELCRNTSGRAATGWHWHHLSWHSWTAHGTQVLCSRAGAMRQQLVGGPTDRRNVSYACKFRVILCDCFLKISVRVILISDIGYQHIGRNQNYGGWRATALRYPVCVICGIWFTLQWLQPDSRAFCVHCVRGSHNMLPHRAHSYL